MKKKMMLRALLGFPVGVAIGYFITILISLSVGGGRYLAAAPALIASAGSEVAAVGLQALLCGLIGSVFAAASTIWEIETWSIARQTGLYFLVLLLALLPAAYLLHWMEHTLGGVLLYAGTFVGIFVVMWLGQYLLLKKKVDQINTRLNRPR